MFTQRMIDDDDDDDDDDDAPDYDMLVQSDSGAAADGQHSRLQSFTFATRFQQHFRESFLRPLGVPLRGDECPGGEACKRDTDGHSEHREVRTDPVDERHRRLGKIVPLDFGKVGGLHRGEPPGAGGVAVGRGAEPKNRDWRVAGVKMICGPPRGLRSAARVVDSAHDAPALSISPAATIG